MVSRPVYHILLVDDHPVVRVGIREQLGCANDLRIAGEAASAADGIAQAAALYVRSLRERFWATGGCV